MTREEKIKLAIEKGFTYDEMTGKIYGVRGNEIKSNCRGYNVITFLVSKKRIQLKAHQFGYYIKYNKVVDYIDHINGIRNDNRICNLREVTAQGNQHNRLCKGYTYCKKTNKYRTQITLGYKAINIGRFNTEQEARQAYLDAKKKYHMIGE
jgi:hypothetical protein